MCVLYGSVQLHLPVLYTVINLNLNLKSELLALQTLAMLPLQGHS